MAIPRQDKFDHGSGLKTTARPTHSPSGENVDFAFPLPEPSEVPIWGDVPDDVEKPVKHLSNATYPPDKED